MSDQAKHICGEFLPYMRNKYRIRESGIYIDPACKALRLEIEKFGVMTSAADNNGHDVTIWSILSDADRLCFSAFFFTEALQTFAI